jgi:uncharacterized protein YbjQ (UPF0145 family)
MCNTCGCKDAESFEAYAHQGLTKLYGISGGVKIQSTVQRIIADINEGQGFADDEYYYLTEDERDEAYEEMEFDAESFESNTLSAKEYVKLAKNIETHYERDDWNDLYVEGYIDCLVDNGLAEEILAAESFEAQTKLTDYTRGKDWEGKPYTGQIFPDHPDLDPELADRNKDGKMASWERAIGNQVAKGKSRFKAPRKMTKTTTKFTQRKPITAASSLLPYAIAVGALATILGLRGKE